MQLLFIVGKVVVILLEFGGETEWSKIKSRLWKYRGHRITPL